VPVRHHRMGIPCITMLDRFESENDVHAQPAVGPESSRRLDRFESENDAHAQPAVGPESSRRLDRHPVLDTGSRKISIVL